MSLDFNPSQKVDLPSYSSRIPLIFPAIKNIDHLDLPAPYGSESEFIMELPVNEISMPAFDPGYNEMQARAAEPFMRKIICFRDLFTPIFDDEGNFITFKKSELVQHNVHHAIPVELFLKLNPYGLRDLLSPFTGLEDILTTENYPRGDSLLNMGNSDESDFHANLTQSRDSYFNEQYSQLSPDMKARMPYVEFVKEMINQDWRRYPINQYLALSMVAINILNTARLDTKQKDIYQVLRKKRKLANQSNLDRTNEKDQMEFIELEIGRALMLRNTAIRLFPELYDKWSYEITKYNKYKGNDHYNERKERRGKTEKWGNWNYDQREM